MANENRDKFESNEDDEDLSSAREDVASGNGAKSQSGESSQSIFNSDSQKKDFSLRHFLKGDTVPAGSLSNCSATSRTANSTGLPSLGARPKIPQYSLHNGSVEHMPRMKRSPKFPSFDSHASLSEYSEEVQPHFVQRSHSNYEVESPLTMDRRSPADLRQPPISGPGTSRNNGEFSSALPDFVKDHLGFEQWFQKNFQSDSTSSVSNRNEPSSSSSQLSSTEPNQPSSHHDTEPSSRPSRPLGYLIKSSGDNMPFDLMFNSSSSYRRNNSPTIPLDLPPYNEHRKLSGLDSAYHRQLNSNDLPLDLTETRSNSGRNGIIQLEDEIENPLPQADMIQTLPDFLSDGPIHSSGRLADVAQDLPNLDSPEENSSNIISRLRLENDRLRHELDETRRILSDQSRQVTELERTCRNSEIQRNGILLEKNKLLQKVSQLNDEIDRLKRPQNSPKEDEDGAVGGDPSSDSRNEPHVYPRAFKTQQISRELLKAAFNAESDLRKLLSGVDNLRLMAKWIETLDRKAPEDPLEDYLLSDCDDDDTGPTI